MDYLELLETQEKIVSYHKRLRNKISYVDENGCRKLSSYYFLSAEVAAYKLLDNWLKAMDSDLDEPDDEIIHLIDLIESLLEEDYEDFDAYEADLSMPLWYHLTKEFEGEAFLNFNLELFLVASMAEVAKGMPVEECLFVAMDTSDLKDPNMVSYAYSLAHDYLISFSNERLEEFALDGYGINPAKSELYKLHFNLFQ